MVNSNNINSLIRMIVCDDNDKRCMYRECDQCKNKTIEFELNEEEGRQVT